MRLALPLKETADLLAKITGKLKELVVFTDKHFIMIECLFIVLDIIVDVIVRLSNIFVFDDASSLSLSLSSPLPVDKSVFATPFSVAIMNGHDSCVQALINAGHGVNIAFPFPFSVGSTGSAEQMTPIMLACLYGKVAVMRVLLSYQADCTLSDSTESNMLHYAAKAGVQAVGKHDIKKESSEFCNVV